MCNTHCFPPSTKVARMRLNVMLHAHRLSCSTLTTVTVYEGAIWYSCLGIKISSLWLRPPCFCLPNKPSRQATALYRNAINVLCRFLRLLGPESSLVVTVCHCNGRAWPSLLLSATATCLCPRSTHFDTAMCRFRWIPACSPMLKNRTYQWRVG
jgi:hypothetical protein